MQPHTHTHTHTHVCTHTRRHQSLRHTRMVLRQKHTAGRHALAEMRESVLARCMESSVRAGEKGLQRELRAVLKALCEKYDDLETLERIEYGAAPTSPVAATVKKVVEAGSAARLKNIVGDAAAGAGGSATPPGTWHVAPLLHARNTRGWCERSCCCAAAAAAAGRRRRIVVTESVYWEHAPYNVV